MTILKKTIDFLSFENRRNPQVGFQRELAVLESVERCGLQQVKLYEKEMVIIEWEKKN